jgi:hypothetical protein
MGFVALQRIAAAMAIPVTEDADPDSQISVSYEEFASVVLTLKEVGYPVEVSAEEGWPHFRGWRVNYDTVALALARAVDAPPALWSGSRRWPSAPVPPQRPANRQATDAVQRAYP